MDLDVGCGGPCAFREIAQAASTHSNLKASGCTRGSGRHLAPADSGKAAATLDTFTTEKLAKAELVMEEKLGSESLGSVVAESRCWKPLLVTVACKGCW